MLTLGLIGEEVVNLGHCAVEGNDIVAVICGIQDQVLAHNSQADEAEISSRHIVSLCRIAGAGRVAWSCPTKMPFDSSKTGA